MLNYFNKFYLLNTPISTVFVKPFISSVSLILCPVKRRYDTFFEVLKEKAASSFFFYLVSE